MHLTRTPAAPHSLLLIPLACALLVPSAARAATLTVPAGSVNGIKAAITAAQPGDLILVRTGVHDELERIVIPEEKRGLILSGEPRSIVRIGNTSSVVPAITVHARNVGIGTIDFRPEPGAAAAELLLQVYGNNFQFAGNIVRDFRKGIQLLNVTGGLIERNLWYAPVERPATKDTEFNTAVLVIGTGVTIHGSFATRFNRGVEIQGGGNTVRAMRIDLGRWGIVAFDDRNVIESNSLASNDLDGLSLQGSDNTVTLNTATQNGRHGIDLPEAGSRNRITKNKLLLNAGCGIFLSRQTSDNVVTDNTTSSQSPNRGGFICDEGVGNQKARNIEN